MEASRRVQVSQELQHVRVSQELQVQGVQQVQQVQVQQKLPGAPLEQARLPLGVAPIPPSKLERPLQPARWESPDRRAHAVPVE